jgi:hypothetical protein
VANKEDGAFVAHDEMPPVRDFFNARLKRIAYTPTR